MRGTTPPSRCPAGSLTACMRSSHPGTMCSGGGTSLDVHHPIIKAGWRHRLASAFTHRAGAAALMGEKRCMKAISAPVTNPAPTFQLPSLCLQIELLLAAWAVWKSSIQNEPNWQGMKFRPLCLHLERCSRTTLNKRHDILNKMLHVYDKRNKTLSLVWNQPVVFKTNTGLEQVLPTTV